MPLQLCDCEALRGYTQSCTEMEAPPGLHSPNGKLPPAEPAMALDSPVDCPRSLNKLGPLSLATYCWPFMLQLAFFSDQPSTTFLHTLI